MAARLIEFNQVGFQIREGMRVHLKEQSEKKSARAEAECMQAL